MQLNRRDFLRLSLVGPPLILAACSGDDQEPGASVTSTDAAADAPTDRGGRTGPQAASSPELAPTPACGDEPTPPQTDGPFVTPDTPERTSLLEPGLAGAALVVEGYVLTRSCRPVAGARRLIFRGLRIRSRKRSRQSRHGENHGRQTFPP